MRQLIFASNNIHKIQEISTQLNGSFNILTLKEAGIEIDIAEPHNTLEANASEKSGVIHLLTGKDCFSEDTGLEVHALNNEPGVKTARYAGENKNDEENITKLLKNLTGIDNRKAQFRTIISLRINGKEYFFEGICRGKIASQKIGSKGFGYDPIFIPDGYQQSFAEMPLTEKNRVSHRGKAVNKFICFLQQLIS